MYQLTFTVLFSANTTISGSQCQSDVNMFSVRIAYPKWCGVCRSDGEYAFDRTWPLFVAGWLQYPHMPQSPFKGHWNIWFKLFKSKHLKQCYSFKRQQIHREWWTSYCNPKEKSDTPACYASEHQMSPLLRSCGNPNLHRNNCLIYYHLLLVKVHLSNHHSLLLSNYELPSHAVYCMALGYIPPFD